VLKLLEQLQHYVLEMLFPTRLLEGCKSLPYRQTATTPTRGHLRLDARGEDVWEITQQYQGGDRRGADGGQPRPYDEKGSFL
jgi:hypothetical protein